MNKERENTEAPLHRLLPMLYAAVFLIAAAVRIGLLLTSQSLPDGDEAVEGLMAMHVLEYGIHPLYAYGVHYGAGAGVEVHLAALLFRIFGCSEFNLKCAAFLIWLPSCLLLYAVVKKKTDARTAWISLILYAWCPALLLDSLKVSGGHQVAVTAGLLALWLVEDVRFRPAGAALLPFAAYLHPVVAPYCLTLFLYALYLERKNSTRLLVTAAAFAAACLIAWLLLSTDTKGIHHPESRGFQLFDSLSAVMKTVPWLFIPNMNAACPSGPVEALISFLWLGATIIALAHAVSRRAFGWIFLVLGSTAVIFAVRPDLLAQRHLMMVYPLICILLAFTITGTGLRRTAKTGLAVLLVSGGLVSLIEMGSPYIYGAGAQSSGINREEFRGIMHALEAHNVHHVYSLDPMLQWNIIFSSREKILARWREPNDRVPRYTREVDRARMAGEPVALVYSLEVPEERRQELKLLLQPDRAMLGDIFVQPRRE